MRRILLRDGKLFYNRGGTNESELVFLGIDRFVMREQPTVDVFFRAVRGGLTMEVGVAGQRPSAFQGVSPPDTASARVTAGVGTYSSEELGVAWKLGLGDGKLVLQ